MAVTQADHGLQTGSQMTVILDLMGLDLIGFEGSGSLV